jgi:ribosomal protein L7/L12
MNPKEKGWLKNFMAFNKGKYPVENAFGGKDIFNEEEYLYAILQPSGILYGHPIQPPFLSDINFSDYEDKDKMKLLLADSFMGNAYRHLLKQSKDTNDIETFLIEQITDFYSQLFPTITDWNKNVLFGRKKKDHLVAEMILGKRISLRKKWDKNFWTSFFQNSLLFLDVFYFNHWINPDIIISKEEIAEQYSQIRLHILGVIAAAAHANQIVEIEEKNLFDYFLHSCYLPVEKEKEAARFIDKGFSLEDMDFSQWNDCWLIRKYLLELAVLTIWSDQDIHVDEEAFILKLAAKLHFDHEEVEKSMLAIESFVLSNYDQVHYLQEKQNYKIVTQRFSRSMKRMLNFYKNSIVTEVKESKELVSLLNKSSKEKLTEEEKEKVRQQLIDILKTLPIFALIALPGRTLTLPVLFKVLPKNVLPSAFQN